MEIRRLELIIDDQDLTRELTLQMPRDAEIKDLRVKVVPEGIRVTGVYPTMMMAVAFETLWSVTLEEDGVVEARLVVIQVAGWQTPGPLRAVIWGMVRESVPKQPGLAVTDDAIRLAVGEAIAGQGVPVKLTLTAVECEEGRLVVRA